MILRVSKLNISLVSLWAIELLILSLYGQTILDYLGITLFLVK